MRLENLKNDFPETPESIHRMIEREVYKQVNSTNKFSKKRSRSRNLAKVAAAALVIVFASSTVTFAATKLYQLYVKDNGTYSVATGVESEEKISLPKKIRDIKFSSDYLPNGMVWTEEGDKLVFKDEPSKSGITIDSLLLDQTGIDEDLIETGVVSSEQCSFGKWDGFYVEYQNLVEGDCFNQRIYLLCPEFQRVVVLYIGEDVLKEDAFKFAGNMNITETDEFVETDSLFTWSEFVHPETEEDNEVTNGKIRMREIGEEILLPNTLAVDVNGNDVESDSVSVRVNDVKICDDFGMLNPSFLPKEWENALDADGRLKQNRLLYIKKGDGINSVDEIVDEEMEKQKVVVISTAYTNTSDIKLKHICYLGVLKSLKKNNDGEYQIYNQYDNTSSLTEAYDFIREDGVACLGEMGYSSSVDDYSDGGNYISSLAPGESIEITMAWIVNERDLQNLYLDLDMGSAYSIGDSDSEVGDIFIGTSSNNSK